MSNATVTQQILQAVESAKSRAQTAEQAFDRANSSIQRQASQSINLFGGSAASTVANIARDVRRACDDLYSAYQSLIVTLDETCRPLLSEDPDVVAVKSVAELMKQFNEDSEIESNFTASLNGNGLGDVAGSRYIPSMNCKMIQRYWEDRYATWPGRAEQEAAAKRDAEARANQEYDEKMQRYEQQMQLYEQQMQAYQTAYAQWDAESKKITAKRASELTARQKAYKKKLLDQLQQDYNKKKREAEKTKKSLEAELQKAENDLAHAGFFAFGAKSAAKRTIKEKTTKLELAKIALARIEHTYYEEQQDVDAQLKAREYSLTMAIEREFPIPKAPQRPVKPTKPVKSRPAVTPTPSYRSSCSGNEALKQAILDSMIYGEKYTVTDIIMTCPEVADMTNQQVSALLRQLVTAGDVVRTEDARKAYFELA